MIKLKNSHILNELEIRCLINENEYNCSLNPTLQTGSFGDLKQFALDSTFTPYITTVGLYNDSNELLAVAKLGQPTRVSSNTDTTFIIKIDI